MDMPNIHIYERKYWNRLLKQISYISIFSVRQYEMIFSQTLGIFKKNELVFYDYLLIKTEILWRPDGWIAL